jgi:CDP-diacylglycerol--glycerol-3-phosphate 3-phosphatidyltransferase
MTIANTLSVLRIGLAPVLLALAWHGAAHAFTPCLTLALLTDIADGKVARWLGQTSLLGARLDSWADLSLYLCLPLCGVLLRPEFVRTEAIWFAIAVGSSLVPVGVGLVRFGRLTSYHTRAVKLAAYLLGGGSLAVFAGGHAWPFRIATVVFVCAEIEEVAITFALPCWHANVRSLSHARALRRAAR